MAKSDCEIDSNLELPKCRQRENTTHVFVGNEYFRDGKYYGDVIFRDENIIKVSCNNGNKYMRGQILTITTTK